jgi:hypothetical protein
MGRLLTHLRNHMPLTIMLRCPCLLARDEYGDSILGPPLAPPAMTKPAVIAEATRFCRVLSDHPHRLQYGSYRDWSTRRAALGVDGATTWETIPTFDAWKVTVTGLSLPRPGGRRGGMDNAGPHPITRLTILIDDKVGTYYSALGR